MSARLAMIRWAWRVAVAEWRQHVLVVSMIAFGIAIATLLVTTAVRFQEPIEAIIAAPAVVDLKVSSELAEDALVLEAALVANELEYPETEYQVFGRPEFKVAGWPWLEVSGPVEPSALAKREADGTSFYVEGPELMGADPLAPPGSVNFSLLSGSWPKNGEVALTQRAADLLAVFLDEDMMIGQTWEMFGAHRMIVGIWENPNRLDSAVALVPQDEVDHVASALVLLPSRDHPAAESLTSVGTVTNDGEDPSVSISAWVLDAESEKKSAAGNAALSVLAGSVLCMQIAVLASAGFTVLTARRTRQLAMLSAMGAKPHQISLVLWATGAICGLAGGVIGAGVGIGLSIGSTPVVQRALNHRIGFFEIPWLLVLLMLPLALLTSMAAAWWPARRVRKASTVESLGAIQPPATGVGKTLVGGLALAGVGSWLMIEGVPKNSSLWVFGGVTALTVGCLMLAPAAIAVLGAVAGRSPLPIRTAWRDLNRNRGRSATAVAAAAMAIAVPFGFAAFMASLAQFQVPSVPENVVVLNGYDSSVEANDGATAFAPVVDSVEGAVLVPILLPVDRAASAELMEQHGVDPDGPEGDWVEPFHLRLERGAGEVFTSVAYSTPELLRAMGLAEPGAEADLITTVRSELVLPGPGLVVQNAAQYGNIFPEVLIVGDLPGLSRDDVVVYNWVLWRAEPFTQLELDTIQIAARRDGSISTRMPDTPDPLTALRTAALVVAGLLALGVVAVSIALIRVENEGQASVLAAIGASPRVSRSIGAATALGLVLPAIVIAVGAAFAALTAIYRNPDEQYDFVVPWPELAVVLVLLPVLAVLGGWLVGASAASRSTLSA